MTLTLIILFILVGLILIWLEFFVVPGVTIAGIGGLILLLGGIYFAYSTMDRTTGHVVMLSSLLALVLLLALSFRGKTWSKTALNTNCEGQVEGINVLKVHSGDVGTTISRLAPMGKVLINGEMIEAKSKLGFIDENVEIVVVEIYSTNVLVEKTKKG